MSAISAQDVNKLRQMTGAGMMDCKKALTEADGDFEKAIEILRKKDKKFPLPVQIEMPRKVLYLLRLATTRKKQYLLRLTAKLTLLQKMKNSSHWAD